MPDCQAPRHDDGDRPDVEPHAHLCRPCRYGLSRDLRRLPGYHADLDLIPGRGSIGARGSGDGLPYNDTVSECRSQIRHDLTVWTMNITKERGLDAPPPMANDGWSENPVAAMAGWLHGQVTWATFRGWAPHMAGAIADDTGKARALLDPWVRKRYEVHTTCLEHECAGRLWATVYAEDDKRRPSVDCDTCGARWMTEQWLRLGTRIRQRTAMPA